MRVVVGLSGGVDSSVCAKLLIDQGHEVIGVFMKNWDEDDPNCPAAEDSMDARNTADKLGIPFYVFDFSKEYWEHVFEYFLAENKKGRTPNADILCNKFVKFGAFLQKAKELGADKIAMGHYAKNFWNEKIQEWELQIPKDRNKDQTYFLYQLNQEQLLKTLFPLQDLEKKEVRSIAKKSGFKNADKKDSVGICMVGDRNYTEFLQKYLKKTPGKIIDAESKKQVGEHTGLSFYTIGQRKTLGIGGIKNFPEAPWFVIRKDFKKNELLVSQDEDLLLGKTLEAGDLHWISNKKPVKNFKCEAKIRYRSDSVLCEVFKIGNKLQVKFETPVRAITAGQSIVFYDGKICLGGGIIS